MDICGNCGVIAPTERDKCDSCKSPLHSGANPSVPERPDGKFWIQVRAQYKCRHCEKRTPINHVDVDGTFTCLRCQRDQGADAGIWTQGLRFCHEVGDLAGPDPEGRHPDPKASLGELNKWSDIGVTRSKARMEMSETIIGDGIRLRSLYLDARPGVPLCTGCKSPLKVTVKEPGSLQAQCESCNADTSYEVDPKAHKQHSGFWGALGDDHRTDQTDAKLSSAEPGAPVAILCPGCGAALDLAATDHFVTCKFCQTASKIPSRMRAQLFEDGVEMEPFWLLFDGASQARTKMARNAEAARNKAKKQQARERDRAMANDSRASGNTNGRKRKKGASKKSPEETRRLMLTVLIAAIIAGAIVYGVKFAV